MKRYYRFQSLDPVFINIVRTVYKCGALVGNPPVPRNFVLFEGVVYDYGLALGRTFPRGSDSFYTHVYNNASKPTVSFPADLHVTAESLEKLAEVEKKFELENIPEERRRFLHPAEPWRA